MTKRELTGAAAGLALWGMTALAAGFSDAPLINYSSLFAAALAGSWIAGRNCVKVARGVVLSACLIRLVFAPPGDSLVAVLLLVLELLAAFTLATVAGLIVALYRLRRFHHVPRRGQD
ncbi:MAG: hypothetical protein ACOX20_11020 [Limnochordia bacterium]|jgi:hypothetical protein|nr:hypothetical protein [Bacillota bacterium]